MAEKRKARARKAAATAPAKKAAAKARAKQPAKAKASARKAPAARAASKKSASQKREPTAAAKAAAARRNAARRAARRKPAQAVAVRKEPGKAATQAAKRSKRYMNEKHKERFREILRNWKQQLMEEVDRTVTHMKDESGHFPDPADRASKEEEFSLELRTRDRERKLIRKIDKTLELIDQDEYGYCESCGVEIGLKRLEARPTATQCVDCKTLDEIKEQQTGLR